MHRLISTLFTTVLLTALTTTASGQVGYGPTDFIVAGCNTGNIAVLNQNFVFQDNVASGLGCATGLDLMSNGNLVTVSNAGSANSATVRFYNSLGFMFGSFTDGLLGRPLDVKSMGFSSVFASGGDGASGIGEFDFNGGVLNTIGARNYTSVVVLPGSILWAGWFDGGPIDVYDLNAPDSLLTTIDVGAEGQTGVASMYYSPSTNTVLITDSNTGIVWERHPDGTLEQQFTGGYAQFGVTRGPSDDVFATECFGASQNGIHRWNEDGTYLGFTALDTAQVSCPQNIVWAGNEVITAATVSVGGRVLTPDGRGLTNATVFLTDQSGNARMARTGSFGYYSFDEVEVGETYSIGVLSKKFQYTPRVISINDSLLDLDFIPQTQSKR